MQRATRLLIPVLCLAATVACGKADSQPSRTLADGGPHQPSSVPPPPDVGAVPPDAERSPTGLAWKVLKPGAGTEHPGPTDRVSVLYTGWSQDGRSFVDTKGKPQVIPVRRSPGWSEALQAMVVGEKRRLWMTPELAANSKSGPAGLRVFEVELLGVVKSAAARPPAPEIPPPADVAAAPADARKTKSGIAFKVLKPGKGKVKPTTDSYVQVNYTGWTTDGKSFDSTASRGTPAAFPVTGVIAGWTEMLLDMTPGEQRRVWIPEELAYKGQPARPQGMLVFDIELLQTVKLPAPADVAAPPKDAQRSASGLASKVLAKGKGTARPTATSKVTVHYSGWTIDGKLFDSSVGRFAPATFPLNRVIAGWTEGLQLMVAGERRRFWIPVDLAYRGQPGKPAGMLVFDVELLSIE